MPEKKYYLKFYIDIEHKKEVSEKEKVDFRKISSIINVIKDQLVAEVVPEENLTDKDIEKYYQEIGNIEDAGNLFSEEHFYIDDKDPSKIYAKISGNFYKENGKFYIKEKITVENVDFSTGNIHFVGDVVIKGDIKPGFEVKARNVFVGGNVDNSKVIAGEKIVVKGGVVGLQGSYECILRAEKTITLNFIENSHVECNGSVYIKKSSMHTDIYSNENIVVSENPGYIVGGEIIAKKNILVRVVGSKWGTRTILKVGINPFKYLRLKEFLARKEKREKLLEEVEKSLKYLNEVLENAKNSDEKIELEKEIEDIKAKKEKFQKRLKRLDKIIRKLKEEISEENEKLNLDEAKIYVFEKVYPGVELRLGLNHHRIYETIEGRNCFYLDENKEVKYREFE